MVDLRIEEFLETLIDVTKDTNNLITWRYLDTNSELCTNMGWHLTGIASLGVILSNSNRSFKKYNESNSFYAQQDSTYLVLLKQDETPVDLYVIPNTYKNIIHIKSSDYGESLTILHNIVMNKFPSGEKFLDSFISTHSKDKE